MWLYPSIRYISIARKGKDVYRGHPTLSRGKEGVSHHEFNRHMEEAMHDQPDCNPPKDLVDHKDPM